jgi:hypothetical protein
LAQALAPAPRTLVPLDAETVRATLGCLLKDEHDVKATGEEAVAELLEYAAKAS